MAVGRFNFYLFILPVNFRFDFISNSTVFLRFQRCISDGERTNIEGWGGLNRVRKGSEQPRCERFNFYFFIRPANFGFDSISSSALFLRFQRCISHGKRTNIEGWGGLNRVRYQPYP